MIKNWTVITESVKQQSDGLAIRERYLLNRNHPNHKHTENIISIIGNEETSRRIAIVGENHRLKQQVYSKRGRPLSSYAMEYCLTLPKGYRPTKKQWVLITQDCCLAIAKFCRLNQNEFNQYKRQVRAVLHQQSQDGKRGSGDHIHLVIGKVVEGRVLRELQQKQITRLIKLAFNKSMLEHVGIDYRSYKPIDVKKGRRLSSWQYQQKKADEAMKIQKLISKMQDQTDKWLKARNEANTRQMRRQENRIAKTNDELQSHSLSKRQAQHVLRIKKLIL